MILFRNGDRRYPFLWESADQPAMRWHADGEGPAQYLADTPDGAWAEFLRHEEITDPVDLRGIARSLWAVQIDLERNRDLTSARVVDLDGDVLTGDASSYPACQAEARRLRESGWTVIVAPSAALKPDAARGYRVDNGMQQGPPRTGEVYVFFGPLPDAVGWAVVVDGRPPPSVLAKVRHLGRPHGRD